MILAALAALVGPLLVASDAGWELAGNSAARTAVAPIMLIPLDRGCKPR